MTNSLSSIAGLSMINRETGRVQLNESSKMLVRSVRPGPANRAIIKRKKQ